MKPHRTLQSEERHYVVWNDQFYEFIEANSEDHALQRFLQQNPDKNASQRKELKVMEIQG